MRQKQKTVCIFKKQETMNGLETRRRAILDDLENPKMRKKMSERTIEEKYQKVGEIEGEVARLNAVLNRPTKYIPLPDLISLIEQLRANWDSLPPAKIRDVALVLATLKDLADRDAQLEEVLQALPKFSQTAISNMSLRECGRRIVPKGSHRLDAYMTREDMSIIEQYGIGIDQIAALRGAIKAREFNGNEY